MRPETGAEAVRVSKTVAAAVRALGPRDGASRLEAEVLLAHVLGVGRAALLARPEMEIPPQARARFEALIARRTDGEPVAYLTGTREFWSIPFEVSRDVLIPRPETERLVEAALERLPLAHRRRVAELGTGCGAVAVAISRERPRASIVATDISLRALAVARQNVTRTGSANIRLLACDWLNAIAAPAFDLILSNPPYVADSDPHLCRGDLPMEPRLALAGGPDGLEAIRGIVAAAKPRLAEKSALLLEHGFDQGTAVRALLKDNGFLGIFTLRDYAGHERISGGHK
jgi:release factor glutamine methyltransferase